MAPRANYAGVLALTLIAASVTAALSSAGLAAWADQLPDSAATRWASAAAHALDNTMTNLGINRITLAVQTATRNAESTKFQPLNR